MGTKNHHGELFAGMAKAKLTRRDMLKRGAAAGLAVPAIAGLLDACGGSAAPTNTGGASNSTTGTSTVAAKGQPKSGGTISMSLADADVQNFDPIIPTDNMSIWTMVLIYDQLVRNAPDGKSVEAGLAEKWEASTDGLTYTFNLRNAQFHDGSTATASDCVYSLNRVVTSKDSQWSWMFSAVDKLEASDPTTVKVTLKHTWAPILADMSLFAASIIPQKLHQAKGAALFQAPVGTGPFKFGSWVKQSQVVLKRWDHYWEPGKPYLDELDFLVLTDANTRMLKFQSGELDIATTVPFSQVQALAANSSYVIQTAGAARIDEIGMNNTRKPFDDKLVRQAINYAIDKNAIIKSVLFGYGQLANTALPLMLYHDPQVKAYPFDLTKAKQLIAQSSAKNGFKAELIITSGDPTASQIAQLVQSQVKEIGGTVTIRQVEPGSATAQIHALNYDWRIGYYTTDIIDPDELITFAVVSTGGTKALWTGYQNNQVNQLSVQAEGETDPTKRQQMYYQIQQLSTDDAPLIFLYYPASPTALHNYVQGFHILPTGNYRMWEVWRS